MTTTFTPTRQPAHFAFLALAAITLAFTAACSDTATNNPVDMAPAPPAQIGAVTDAVHTSGAVIAYVAPGSDSVRAHFTSADGTDSGVTPWFGSSAGSLTVLGLRASTTYTLSLDSEHGGMVTQGTTTASYTSRPLPPALAGVRLVPMSGGAMTGGYTLTNVDTPDLHGYSVAFDSTGVIRWYRDFGKTAVFETKQQANGDITASFGESRGFDPSPSTFVEVTPTGDSVRAIVATGSPYTDPHELLSSFDRNGVRTADYLFGYDIRNNNGYPLAGHQLLRISAAGAVDTLVQAWGRWTLSDAIDGPPEADFDHPNSLAFDLDGSLIVSYRDLGAILKIDPSTRSTLWQLGGTHNQFTFVNDPQNGFGGQHCVRVLPNGHLLVFDNGVTHSPQFSRAVEYAIDPVRKTATMVWQYIASPPIFTEYTGSVQRLANGNTLIGWTTSALVDEVAPDGTLLSRHELVRLPGVAANPYRFTRIGNLYRYVTTP